MICADSTHSFGGHSTHHCKKHAGSAHSFGGHSTHHWKKHADCTQCQMSKHVLVIKTCIRLHTQCWRSQNIPVIKTCIRLHTQYWEPQHTPVRKALCRLCIGHRKPQFIPLNKITNKWVPMASVLFGMIIMLLSSQQLGPPCHSLWWLLASPAIAEE